MSDLDRFRCIVSRVPVQHDFAISAPVEGEADLGASVQHGFALYSRRALCVAAAGAFATLVLGGLAGCSKEEEAQGETHSYQGFASDTEMKDYPVTIRIFADSNLLRAKTADNLPRLETYISNYQAELGRGEVTIAIKYLDSAAMEAAMTQGFPEKCDGAVALDDAIDLGVSSGILEGGAGGTSVRKFTATLNESLAVVRKKGGSAQMPAAKTFNGEDSSDGQFNRLQQLGTFEGKIAVPPVSTVEGVMTNAILARWGLYSDESGKEGQYDPSISDIITVYGSIDGVLSALASGEADLGFVARSTVWGNTSAIETVYEPSYTMRKYAGASLVGSEEGGVVRDFLEYVSRMV